MSLNLTANASRALVAAITIITLVSGSTAVSPLFVSYRAEWGVSSAGIAIVFSAYVAALLPVLLFSGGLAERFGRRRVIAGGILSMVLGLTALTFAHDIVWLIVARLLQGAGIGLSVGALSAAITESYAGKLPAGNMLQAVVAVGLFVGPVITAIMFNLGGGVNISYVPSLILTIALFALVPLIPERAMNPVTAQPADVPFAPEVVASALRFALPVAFVAWAGLSLFFSLVPAYLATTLHATNPAVGAAAVLVTQLASLVIALSVRMTPERGGLYGAYATVLGLVLLVAGTTANVWALVILATLLVGGGSGLASGASFGIAGRVGRGHRARTFAHWYLVAYTGYSIPALVIGMLAVHTSFTFAFALVTAVLVAIAAVLPLLRPGRNRNLVPELNFLARAA